MSDNQQIINLYTELAQNPNQDFGWDKGLENAKAHGYKEAWIDALAPKIWDYCAAVGNPFNDAEIKNGDCVVDLGCGAGVDVLVARLFVGEKGKVFGVDITPKMVEIASTHSKEAGYSNIEILESSFDDIALADESVDVVISNGAINLTSCKESVFAEIYRILKPNGKIYFADMIDISEPSCCSIEQTSCCDTSMQEDWANCVAGTMRKDELISLIAKAGFKEVICTGETHYTTADTTRGATFKATKVPSDEKREEHWESLFNRVDYTQVLWHQKSPKESLSFIQKYTSLNANILDVGCGASFLADNLLKEGYKNITLLDTSKTSLDIVEDRIKSDSIAFICEDVLNFKTNKKFDIWHDRAVFHFLLTQKERESYFEVLKKSLKQNGIAIISTFATHGDISCAGLDTVQYDKEKMFQELPLGLTLVESNEFLHYTPKNTTQKYISFVIENLFKN
ncbi:tRNA (adenine57/58-N1)-methyltransferase [hydrothermal vent metagenome]|uniref:tRNA (Adenine57/58-N1)-methyltransferase n=1 Tax=hydrothermal vent metagenome TaxID=652676 RepID=A0A1W1CXF7_9ZZZZ